MTTTIIRLAQPLLAAALFAIVSIYHVNRVSGFSAQLYRRDSYGSPTYNPNLSRSEIIRRAIARDVNRSAKVTRIRTNGAVSDLMAKEGEYLMKIRLGTPALDFIGIADTGSDLVWTQCQTCTKCVPHRMPLYNPDASSSYGKVECGDSDLCPYRKCTEDMICRYEVSYADGASSKGVLSTEVMSIENNADKKNRIQISDFVFGCGNEQKGPYGGEGTGIIGLSPARGSLVSQLGEHSGRKIAYCLVPLNLYGVISTIHFGAEAEITGEGTVTLPMVYEPMYRNYLVTMEAMTIGTKRVKYVDGSAWEADGNMLVDSGATLMWVPKLFYKGILEAVKSYIVGKQVPDVHGHLDYCFKIDENTNLPKVVANFDGGNVPLRSYNVFIRNTPDVMCLAIGPKDDVCTFGNIAQSDFLVGFDYRKETVSFKPSNCH